MANEVRILVRADDHASKAFKEAGQAATGFGKVLGDVAKIAGGFVLAQGILKAPDFLMSAAKAAAEDAASQARLKTAVENTGVAYDDYKQTLDAVIKAGQALGFTDDQTRDSLSILTAQTGSAEEAVKRYALAQDLARGANIDVVAASRLLGKVTGENVNVLARYGIVVKEGATETELFAAVYQKFHGQAQTFADSTAGKMARLKDAMGELKERIGSVVLPAMTAVADVALKYVIPALESTADWVGSKLVKAFEDAATFGGKLAGPVLGSLDSIRSGISDFIGDLGGFIGDIKQRVEQSVILFKIGFKMGIPGGAEGLDPLQRAALEAGAAFKGFTGLLKDIGFIDLFEEIKVAVAEGLGAMKGIIEFMGGRRAVLQSFAAALAIVTGAWIVYTSVTLGAAAASKIVAAAFALTPIGGLMLLATAILLVAQNWGKLSSLPPIKAAIDQLTDLAHLFQVGFSGGVIGGEFSTLERIAFSLGKTLREEIPRAFAAVKESWETEMRPALASARELFGDLISVVEGVALQFKVNWGVVRSEVEFALRDIAMRIGGLIQAFSGSLEVISGVIALVSDLFHGRWREAWEDLKQIATGILDTLLGTIKAMFGSIPEEIGKLAGQAYTAANNFAKGIERGIMDGLQSVVAWVVRQINALIRAYNSLPFLPDIGEIAVPGERATGMHVSGFAGGTPYVPQDMLAFLHRGERVVPADQNRGTAGGVTVNMPNATIYARDEADATRSAGDMAWGIGLALRVRGLVA